MKNLILIFAAVAIMTSCATPQSDVTTSDVDSIETPQVDIDTTSVFEATADSISTDSVN